MPPVVEKRVPIVVSLLASLSAVAICGYIWHAGQEDPRKWHSNMAFNYHNKYSAYLACHDCHKPDDNRYSLALDMTCYTAECHVEYDPATPRPEAVAIKTEEWDYYPDTQERIDHFLDLHDAVEQQDCWSCHPEHTQAPRRVPEGWTTWEEQSRQLSGKERFRRAPEEWTSLVTDAGETGTGVASLALTR